MQNQNLNHWSYCCTSHHHYAEPEPQRLVLLLHQPPSLCRTRTSTTNSETQNACAAINVQKSTQLTRSTGRGAPKISHSGNSTLHPPPPAHPPPASPQYALPHQDLYVETMRYNYSRGPKPLNNTDPLVDRFIHALDNTISIRSNCST